MFDLKNEGILICLLFIVVGYCIAKMFSNSCERFRIGAQGPCPYCSFGCDKKNKCLDAPPPPPPAPMLDNFECRHGPGGTTSYGHFEYDNCRYLNFYRCYENICQNAGYSRP